MSNHSEAKEQAQTTLNSIMDRVGKEVDAYLERKNFDEERLLAGDLSLQLSEEFNRPRPQIAQLINLYTGFRSDIDVVQGPFGGIRPKGSRKNKKINVTNLVQNSKE